MDNIKQPINYVVATIGTTVNGSWIVTYYGDVPEQGGINLGRRQLTFIKLQDALTFLSRELANQDYVKIIKDRKK